MKVKRVVNINTSQEVEIDITGDNLGEMVKNMNAKEIGDLLYFLRHRLWYINDTSFSNNSEVTRDLLSQACALFSNVSDLVNVALSHTNGMKHKLLPHEIQLIHDGQAIQAIKEVRARLGSGLKEAKDLVDAYKASKGL